MPKKLTTETFIEKANIKHGEGTFNYSDSVYTKGNEHIKVICPTHGVFSILPYLHLDGRGCQQCGMERCKPKTLTQEEFINKAGIKFNNLIFDKSIYTNSNTSIIVTCPLHGDFTTTPNKLMNTKIGCKQCATVHVGNLGRLMQLDFLNKSFDVHGDYYDYSLAKYITNQIKVKIICPEHGIFEQTPHLHMKGAGCQICGKEKLMGFKRSKFIEKYLNKTCVFYIIKMFQKDEEFIKIGITGRSVKERYEDGIPYKYEILNIIEDSPDKIWDLEKENKKILKQYNYKPKHAFYGYTECFSLDALNILTYGKN